MIYFTSDHHFSHANICELAGRPFTSVDQMNAAMVENWNRVVNPEDEVWVLGDFAMGQIANSLPVARVLNGTKYLLSGNHDRMFPDKRNKRQHEWTDKYREAGFHRVWTGTRVLVNVFPFDVRVSHFPYDGDSHGEDRYSSHRPKDDGMMLLHGHTHAKERVSFSSGGTLQIHIGVDAWDFSPVSVQQITELMYD